MSMKFEKSPSAYVYGYRLRLKRCVTFPIIFSDRYDLIESYKHICYWGGLKKVLSGWNNAKIAMPNVFDHTDHSIDRMMLPFVSADSYDPKQVCKHTCWVSKSFRKFSSDLQR